MPISPYVRSLRDAIGTELLVLPSVAAVIFDEERRVLLVQQSDDDLWSTPGGSIEPCEAPADAVVREVWEETGLVTQPERLLGVFGGPKFVVEYPNGDRTCYVISVFECRVEGGRLKQRSDETVAAEYFSADSLATIRTSPWVMEVLPSIFEHRSQALFREPTWKPSQ